MLHFRDMPVGLLHLIPLGLAKHLIVFIISQRDNETLKRMGCHLETRLPSKGLEFFQYIESRQGKDFKSYVSPNEIKHYIWPQKKNKWRKNILFKEHAQQKNEDILVTLHVIEALLFMHNFFWSKNTMTCIVVCVPPLYIYN